MKVTIEQIHTAVQKTDKDWDAKILENWKAMQCRGEPSQSHLEVHNRIRSTHLELFDDLEWADKWLAAYQIAHLLQDCEQGDLLDLYKRSSHKAWILASAIAPSLRLGCDPTFTRYTLFKLAQVLDNTPEQPSFQFDKVNIDSIPDCRTLEEFFSKIADHVLQAFGVTPTDQVRAPIVDIYMRILKNPGKHWPAPSQVGMSDADMMLAMRDKTDDCFERFDAEALVSIFNRRRPSRRDRSPKRK